MWLYGTSLAQSAHLRLSHKSHASKLSGPVSPGKDVLAGTSSPLPSLQTATYSQVVRLSPVLASVEAPSAVLPPQDAHCCEPAPSPGPLDSQHLTAQAGLGWQPCTSPVQYTVSPHYPPLPGCQNESCVSLIGLAAKAIISRHVARREPIPQAPYLALDPDFIERELAIHVAHTLHLTLTLRSSILGCTSPHASSLACL